MAKPMPAIFFGHGNPMNALARNAWTRAWSDIGNGLPKPKAIVCVSAHWYLSGTLVTANEQPRTIHDFGGFPRELFEIKYPAPGDPQLANRVKDLLAPVSVELDTRWGLAHGTWSVLCHVFLKRMCQLYNSVSTTHSRRSSTTKLQSDSPACAMKECSSWEAGTSFTTCTPTRGAANRSRRSTGPCGLKNEHANYCSPAHTILSLLTRR